MSAASTHRRWILPVVCLGFVGVIGVVAVNVWVVVSTQSRLYTRVADVPAGQVALVLGTAKTTAGGFRNPHFDSRMQAAADLYKAGKTKVLLLSGDNHMTGYDEPTDMKNTLVQHGVPESALFLDYAGLRTLDSVVRAKEVFGVKRMTIVSERFHDYRALFICSRYGIEAVALCSDDVSLRFSLKVLIREIFARVKAVLDLYLLQTRPKFLGEKIKIVAVRWRCESIGVRTCAGVCSTAMEALI